MQRSIQPGRGDGAPLGVRPNVAAGPMKKAEPARGLRRSQPDFRGAYSRLMKSWSTYQNISAMDANSAIDAAT